MAAQRDTRASTRAYELAEKRLLEWGAECGRIDQELADYDVVRTMGLRKMIEHAQREYSRATAKGKGKGERTKPRPVFLCLDCGFTSRRWGARVGGYWSPQACPDCESVSSIERGVSARGTETESPAPLWMQSVSSKALEVDRIVRGLPGRMQSVLKRRFLWRQPDRVAARELEIPKDNYQLRLRAAVEWVGELLGLA